MTWLGMGFNIAYESLPEIFPQVDARVLRAVAIEHSEDADAAVEAVLKEVIPFFIERLRPGTPSTCSISGGESSEVCALVGSQTVDDSSQNTPRRAELQNHYNVDTGNQQLVNDAGYKLNDSTCGTCDGRHGDDSNTQSMIPENLHENKIKMSTAMYSPAEPEVSGEPETEDTISGNVCPKSITKVSSDNTPCPTLGTLQDVRMFIDQEINLIDYLPPFEDGNNIVDMTSSNVSIKPVGSGVQLSESTVTASKKATVSSSITITEDVSTSNAAMSQSSQVQAIDVLEEVIARARNHKKKLFSAMESVISLMKEVEVKEEAAEKAKDQAANGGTHILGKIKELEQMLQHAKEANDKHYGEVYGEKAILATELKELQTHGLLLMDERDGALGILEEMHKTLEEMLAAAQNAINLAEQGKLEKEEAAQKSFADLELVMEKVVQESKVLKQQAEENSKLQEFLLDCGHVLDMLKGEIAVICQDVRLLKEKFDAGVPFSKLLYSSQTSFILASSSSPSKASITGQAGPVLDRDDLVPPQEGKDRPQVTKEEEAARDDPNALLDGGWDVFDKHEINA